MRPLNVLATQTALKSAGFDPGNLDGDFGTKTTRALLRYVSRGRASSDFYEKAAPIAATMLKRHGIAVNRDSLAQFLATTPHETGDYTRFAENLFYTTPALLVKNWPRRFPNIAAATPFLRNPKKLAEAVYGYEYRHGTKGDLGNRKGTTDAYDMRGGGWIQTTGFANYSNAAKVTGLPLVEHPELLHDAFTSIEAACAYWKGVGCNELATADPTGRKSRVRVNGGTIGLDDVLQRTARNLIVVR